MPRPPLAAASRLRASGGTSVRAHVDLLSGLYRRSADVGKTLQPIPHILPPSSVRVRFVGARARSARSRRHLSGCRTYAGADAGGTRPSQARGAASRDAGPCALRDGAEPPDVNRLRQHQRVRRRRRHPRLPVRGAAGLQPAKRASTPSAATAAERGIGFARPRHHRRATPGVSRVLPAQLGRALWRSLQPTLPILPHLLRCGGAR